MSCKVNIGKTVLLDVEGTTSPKNFVFDTLFPYAIDNLDQFLMSRWNEKEVMEYISEIRSLMGNRNNTSMEEVSIFISKCMKQDLKLTPIKGIQGMIWEKGYREGKLKGEIYDDVPGAMKKWVNAGRKIYIYSSGSVLAQKLIFRYSSKGDLSSFISGYFDTKVGAKVDASSYNEIAGIINFEPESISFITDSPLEVKAASEAGFHTIRINRETREIEMEVKDKFIRSFNEIC